MFGLVALAATLATPSPAMAQVPAGTWSRAASEDATFSVETPCSAEEIALGRLVPVELAKGLAFAPASRVVCAKNGVLLMVGIQTVPAQDVRDAPFFDQFVKMMKDEKEVDGAPILLDFGGRRAIFNREATPTAVAQTGLIELDRAHVVLVVAGGEVSSAETATAMGGAIDRFFHSIEVSGK